jgi:hypothetical protein
MLLLTCSSCGSQRFFRRRRRLPERVYCAEIYQCKECGCRERVRYWQHWHWASRTVRCPLCGNGDVKRLARRDGIDRMYKNPLSYLQRLAGAPIYHCQWCRLQFHDLRPRATNLDKREPAEVVET